MTRTDDSGLSLLLSNNADLRLIEPHIYSVVPAAEVSSPYDSSFGNVYDRVACSALYNRIFWGYSIAEFSTLTREALTSSGAGYVLDLGCGSLAFTAREYIQYSDRPIVLIDQSLKMLRIAKSRLTKLHGTVPANMTFLHADALHLPFRNACFRTIISLNLLHCLNDTKSLLHGLMQILSEDGQMYFTTLIKGNRSADRYLKALADAGKLIRRNIDDHQTVFNQLGMSMKCRIIGNMAFINCGTIKDS